MPNKFTETTHLFIERDKMTGEVYRIEGDDVNQDILNDFGLKLFKSKCVTSRRKQSIPFDEAKMRIADIIYKHMRRTREVDMSYSKLLQHSHSIVRSSSGLKQVLKKMEEDGIIRCFSKIGSRGLFLQMTVSREDALKFITKEFVQSPIDEVYATLEKVDQDEAVEIKRKVNVEDSYGDKDVEYATFDATGLSQDEFEQRVKSQAGHEVAPK